MHLRHSLSLLLFAAVAAAPLHAQERGTRSFDRAAVRAPVGAPDGGGAEARPHDRRAQQLRERAQNARPGQVARERMRRAEAGGRGGQEGRRAQGQAAAQGPRERLLKPGALQRLERRGELGARGTRLERADLRARILRLRAALHRGADAKPMRARLDRFRELPGAERARDLDRRGASGERPGGRGAAPPQRPRERGV